MTNRYRLTIEGDEKLMQQIAQAFDLQGRICLGQFDEVGSALILAVQENTLEKGLQISVSECDDETRDDTQRRWDALMDFKDKLSVLWRSAREEWHFVFHHPPLEVVSPHLGQRERRAYTLWKWMEYYLTHMRVTPENQNLLRGSVHFNVPILRVKDVVVNIQEIEQNARN